MTRDGFDALNVLSDAQFNSARRQIIGLAATHRITTMYEAREFVEDGGLIPMGRILLICLLTQSLACAREDAGASSTFFTRMPTA
jgi:hypothetical protein